MAASKDVRLELARHPFPMIDESLLAKITSLTHRIDWSLFARVGTRLSPDDLPVSDGERAMLDARLADMEAYPDDQSPWPEVKSRLEPLIS
jgi:hypothetical protein